MAPDPKLPSFKRMRKLGSAAVAKLIQHPPHKIVNSRSSISIYRS